MGQMGILGSGSLIGILNKRDMGDSDSYRAQRVNHNGSSKPIEYHWLIGFPGWVIQIMQFRNMDKNGFLKQSQAITSLKY